LRHQNLRLPRQMIHFYDSTGGVPYVIAEDGVVDATLIDRDIEAVWRRGFNTTLDGVRLNDTFELFREVERQNTL
jgi:hypothetical protein